MVESEQHKIDRLLRNWAEIAMALEMSRRNGRIAEYDDELASTIARTARETLEWRDQPR